MSWRPTFAGMAIRLGDRQQLQPGRSRYDLTCLMKSAGFEKVTIIGHSMGGMVSLTYAGAFPDKVSRLVVLDGVTNFPARRIKPADVRIAD